MSAPPAGGLIVVLGGYYAFLGGDSHGSARVLGVVGAIAIWATVVAARRSALLVLLLGSPASRNPRRPSGSGIVDAPPAG